MGTPINRTKGQATIIFAQPHQHTLEMTPPFKCEVICIVDGFVCKIFQLLEFFHTCDMHIFVVFIVI